MASVIDLLTFGVTDTAGAALNAGVVYVYDVGTTNLATIYTDRLETEPASNPVTLDSIGKAEIYADKPIRLVIETSAGVQLYDYGSVGEVSTTATTTSAVLSADERRAVSAKPRYLNDGSDTSQVIIPASATAPAVVFIDGTLYKNTSNVTVDLDTAGRGGLDTGSKAANTPYYLYAIPASDLTTFDVVISATDPDTGPTGFTAVSYIGAFATDEGASTITTFQAANGVYYADDEIEVENHTGDTSTNAETFESLPTTARLFLGIASLSSTVADAAGNISAIDASTNDAFRVEGQVTNIPNHSFGFVPVITAQTIHIRTSNSGQTVLLELQGWVENPMEWD